MVNLSKDPEIRKSQKAYIHNLALKCIEGAKARNHQGKVTKNYVLSVHREHKNEHPYVTRDRLFSAIDQCQDETYDDSDEDQDGDGDGGEDDEEDDDEGDESDRGDGEGDRKKAAKRTPYKARKNPVKMAERTVVTCLARRALEMKRRNPNGRLPPSTIPLMIETFQSRCPFLNVKKIEMALWRESKNNPAQPVDGDHSSSDEKKQEPSKLSAAEFLWGPNANPTDTAGLLPSMTELADVTNAVEAYEGIIRAHGHNPVPKSREEIERLREKADPVYKAKKKTLLDVISKRTAVARAKNGGRLLEGEPQRFIDEAKREFGMDDVLILPNSVRARVRRMGPCLPDGFDPSKADSVKSRRKRRKLTVSKARVDEEEEYGGAANEGMYESEDEYDEEEYEGEHEPYMSTTTEHKYNPFEKLERDIAEGTDGIITDLTIKITRDYYQTVTAQHESAQSRLLRLRAECLEAQAVVQRLDGKKKQVERLLQQVLDEDESGSDNDDEVGENPTNV